MVRPRPYAVRRLHSTVCTECKRSKFSTTRNASSKLTANFFCLFWFDCSLVLCQYGGERKDELNKMWVRSSFTSRRSYWVAESTTSFNWRRRWKCAGNEVLRTKTNLRWNERPNNSFVIHHFIIKVFTHDKVTAHSFMESESSVQFCHPSHSLVIYSSSNIDRARWRWWQWWLTMWRSVIAIRSLLWLRSKSNWVSF